MHTTELFDDLEPCPECGDVSMECACTQPITTLPQLLRAMQACGANRCGLRVHGGEYTASVGSGPRVSLCTADTASAAFAGALRKWEDLVDP